MTAPSSIDPARFLHDQLESASPDLLRSMLTTFINTLMSAEADAVCGAPYGMPGPDRVNVRSPVKNSASAKCLNDLNSLVSPGNPIVIYTCITNGPNEKFSHPANPGALVVYGQCLTDPASGGSGTKQVIEPCTGALNQMWFHNSTLEYVLTANGLCLTDPGSSKVNGTQVVVSICKNVSNQHWKGS
jgi:ricin-type beta-trefoil lectin protein